MKFYASLGNHDDPNQRFYKPFNMGGECYYTYTKGSVRFFVLDKALYELNYELNNRPDWLHIPLAGIMGIIDKS